MDVFARAVVDPDPNVALAAADAALAALVVGVRDACESSAGTRTETSGTWSASSSSASSSSAPASLAIEMVRLAADFALVADGRGVPRRGAALEREGCRRGRAAPARRRSRATPVFLRMGRHPLLSPGRHLLRWARRSRRTCGARRSAPLSPSPRATDPRRRRPRVSRVRESRRFASTRLQDTRGGAAFAVRERGREFGFEPARETILCVASCAHAEEGYQYHSEGGKIACFPSRASTLVFVSAWDIVLMPATPLSSEFLGRTPPSRKDGRGSTDVGHHRGGRRRHHGDSRGTRRAFHVSSVGLRERRAARWRRGGRRLPSSSRSSASTRISPRTQGAPSRTCAGSLAADAERDPGVPTRTPTGGGDLDAEEGGTSSRSCRRSRRRVLATVATSASATSGTTGNVGPGTGLVGTDGDAAGAVAALFACRAAAEILRDAPPSATPWRARVGLLDVLERRA